MRGPARRNGIDCRNAACAGKTSSPTFLPAPDGSAGPGPPAPTSLEDFLPEDFRGDERGILVAAAAKRLFPGFFGRCR